MGKFTSGLGIGFILGMVILHSGYKDQIRNGHLMINSKIYKVEELRP